MYSSKNPKKVSQVILTILSKISDFNTDNTKELFLEHQLAY